MSRIALALGDDLLLASDLAVGRTVYLKYGEAADLRRSLRRLIALRRGRVVLGHGGVAAPGTLEAALGYLDRLESLVASGRATAGIELEDCLPAGETGTDWERRYHARNLEVVAARGLFAA